MQPRRGTILAPVRRPPRTIARHSRAWAAVVLVVVAGALLASQPLGSPWWSGYDYDSVYVGSGLQLFRGDRSVFYDHPGAPQQEVMAATFTGAWAQSMATPMNAGDIKWGPAPPVLPTLTEVVDMTPPAPPAPPSPSEDALRKAILADIQHQVDKMLEVRLREALAPAITRLTDALVREARGELASSLQDIVARAVAQELSRHRGP